MTNVSAEMTNVEKIIVLDYGSQYNQLITRRIREFGVFSELLSHRITAEEVKAMNPKGSFFQAAQIVFMTKEPSPLIQKSLN